MIEDEEDPMFSEEGTGSAPSRSSGFLSIVGHNSPASGAANTLDNINTMRRQVYMNAIQRGMSRLSDNTDKAAALFALGSGLLSPTKSGSLGEALGQGLGASAPFVSKVGAGQRESQDRIDRLTLGAINAEAQNALRLASLGAGGRYAELLRAAGIQPGTPEAAAYIQALRRASGTNVSITNRAETEYGRTRGRATGEAVNSVLEAGRNAPTLLSRLGALETALDRAGPTGLATPVLRDFTRLFSSFGVEVPSLNNMGAIEQASALINAITMDMLGGRLGVGVSNADRSFIQAMAPSISNTPEGNRLIIEILRDFARHDQRRAEHVRRLEAQYGTDFHEISRRLSEWDSQNENVITDAQRRRIDALTNQTPASPGQTGRVVRGQWSGALPEGVPPGSTYRGTTSTGTIIFRAPDGSFKEVTPDGNR
jgi:hypothetical protein